MSRDRYDEAARWKNFKGNLGTAALIGLLLGEIIVHYWAFKYVEFIWGFWRSTQ